MDAKELLKACDAAGQKRAKCTCGREYPSSHDVDCREAVTVLAIYNARASLHKLGFKDEPDGVARARQYAALLEALRDLLEETVGFTLDYVKERLAEAESRKIKYQRGYEQGVADVLRQVRILLEDNEAMPNVAAARAVLATEVKP